MVFAAAAAAAALGVPDEMFAERLERLSYNHPGLLVDLGVGLWAWPLPMDYNNDGLTDLLVTCTDTPSRGTYFFENSGETDRETGLPIFLAGVRIGEAVDNVQISYIDGEPVVTTPNRVYPDFKNTAFEHPFEIPAPKASEIFPEEGRIRANQWGFVDYDGDGVNDLVVGIGFWGEYGWDDAYNEDGQWTRGPLRGYVFWLPNLGTNEDPKYGEPIQIVTSHGDPVDVFGRPSPNFADFTGDGKLDLICGSFLDGFTYFQNIGTREKPIYAPGRPLTYGDERIRMELCMITPVAYDFTGNGFPDLIVGDEDGRVAIVEHTGEIVDGMPRFLPPRYFRQHADQVKFGALATPVGFDWNGDGRDDILVGNTAGHIAFIENLGGDPVKWAAPKLLEADGETIRILAGSNGSIQGPAEEKWGYTTLTVGDWNHDGLPDILVNSIWGKILWYENIGTRTAPKLAAAKPVEVEWEGAPPKPAWNWWDPDGKELVTQWRTTPVAIDWNGDGLTDLVMLDHEGYLALFRRERRGQELVLLPGERVFQAEGEEGPLRLNPREAGRSGRRKLAVTDFDGDGRLDLLLNGKNASLLRNIGEVNGMTVFRDTGQIDGRRLAGHTTSPTMIDMRGDGVADLLIGGEDGFLYFRSNPFMKPADVEVTTGQFAIEARHAFAGTLANGERAFANRSYVWRNVPEQFANWKFVGTHGGERAFVQLTARRAATVYMAAVSDPADLNLNFWERVEGATFFYTAGNGTEMAVFSRAVKAGEQLDIPQGDWAGGILLVPPSDTGSK